MKTWSLKARQFLALLHPLDIHKLHGALKKYISLQERLNKNDSRLSLDFQCNNVAPAF